MLFAILMPTLYKQFSEMGISTEHYLIDWFFTMFTKSLPLDICSRIWDCFFVEGQVFLFITALCTSPLSLSSPLFFYSPDFTLSYREDQPLPSHQQVFRRGGYHA